MIDCNEGRPHTSHVEDQFPSLESESFEIRVRREELGGYSFLHLESDIAKASPVPRIHRRVLLRTPDVKQTDGRAILYSDTYLYEDEPKTYVYINHKVKLPQFFRGLDDFFSERRADFPELYWREFSMWANWHGEMKSLTTRLPFSENAPLDESIRFARIAIPFGDISIDFANRPVSRLADLNNLPVEMQTTVFDSPLFGFDATRTSLWSAFASRIHWAAGSIPFEILGRLIEQAARNPIFA
jgi:hypothetical protein